MEHRPVPDRVPDWTFLTNHAHVLFCLTKDPEIRLRDVADSVGITERAVQRIVTELETAGFITRRRNGRRNSYVVHRNHPLRHPIESHRSVADLLQLILHQGESLPTDADLLGDASGEPGE
ncbi:MAG: winged helix-turn-helix domain-containing protein [Nannocystis sp.]|nr:winged helix-turn-helix domain-containing protein [Nannocystis sp.]MBK9757086.1 winged helix-turn-helix domain-containing protein [Nannocystis sp.]